MQTGTWYMTPGYAQLVGATMKWIIKNMSGALIVDSSLTGALKRRKKYEYDNGIG